MNSNHTSPPARRRRRWLVLLLISLALVVVVPAVGLPLWSWSNSAEPTSAALAALQDDERVIVSDDQCRGWIAFSPRDAAPSTGFVFYPGGLVPPAAYAPPLKAVAASGFLVVVPEMPLNLAVFDPNRAQEIIDAYPSINAWVVGGHSLGGSMAAQFAAGHAGSLAGLVLWASYPSGSADLSGARLAVLSLYGTNDGVLSQPRFDEGVALLPPDAEIIPIVGGNHAQFGSYGEQGGDQPATISAVAQQAEIARLTADFLTRVSR